MERAESPETKNYTQQQHRAFQDTVRLEMTYSNDRRLSLSCLGTSTTPIIPRGLILLRYVIRCVRLEDDTVTPPSAESHGESRLIRAAKLDEAMGRQIDEQTYKWGVREAPLTLMDDSYYGARQTRSSQLH